MEESWGFHGCLGLAEGLGSEKSRLRGYFNLLKFYRDYPYYCYNSLEFHGFSLLY